MLRFIFWILFIVIALVVCALSIANRHDVAFSLDPLPFSFELPLFALLLFSAFIGLILGSVITWLKGSRTRSDYRHQKRENAELKGQNVKLNRDLELAADSSQNNVSPTAAKQIEHQR